MRMHSGRSRGMALITIIAMFTLIGGALVALTVLFATEARRTRSAVAGSQLRQLLLAAAPVAGEELRLRGAAERDVTVDTPVTGATLTLHIKPMDGGMAEVRVSARIPPAVAGQTLTWKREAGQWQLQGAALDPLP